MAVERRHPGAVDQAGEPVTPRGVVVLGVAAVVSVFLLPPVGLVLGVMTLVFAIRLMGATRPQPQELLTPDGVPVTVRVASPGRTNAVFGLVLGITATTLSALLVVMLVAFWGELRTYTTCHNNTITTQGEEKCKTELKNAILHRLGQ
jgi:hypothetical protein